MEFRSDFGRHIVRARIPNERRARLVRPVLTLFVLCFGRVKGLRPLPFYEAAGARPFVASRGQGGDISKLDGRAFLLGIR